MSQSVEGFIDNLVNKLSIKNATELEGTVGFFMQNKKDVMQTVYESLSDITRDFSKKIKKKLKEKSILDKTINELSSNEKQDIIRYVVLYLNSKIEQFDNEAKEARKILDNNIHDLQSDNYSATENRIILEQQLRSREAAISNANQVVHAFLGSKITSALSDLNKPLDPEEELKIRLYSMSGPNKIFSKVRSAIKNPDRLKKMSFVNSNKDYENLKLNELKEWNRLVDAMQDKIPDDIIKKVGNMTFSQYAEEYKEIFNSRNFNFIKNHSLFDNLLPVSFRGLNFITNNNEDSFGDFMENYIENNTADDLESNSQSLDIAKMFAKFGFDSQISFGLVNIFGPSDGIINMESVSNHPEEEEILSLTGKKHAKIMVKSENDSVFQVFPATRDGLIDAYNKVREIRLQHKKCFLLGSAISESALDFYSPNKDKSTEERIVNVFQKVPPFMHTCELDTEKEIHELLEQNKQQLQNIKLELKEIKHQENRHIKEAQLKKELEELQNQRKELHDKLSNTPATANTQVSSCMSIF